MSVLLFTPVAPAHTGPVTNNIYNAMLATSTASPVIATGNDAIIRIASSGAFTVRFGTKVDLLASAAGATDMYFPAGVYIYDMGHLNDSISIFSLAATNVITVSPVVRN